MFEDVDDHFPDIYSNNGNTISDCDDELDDYEQDHIQVEKVMGKITKGMLNKMESIGNIMKSSGWFNKSPDGLLEYDSLNHIKPLTKLQLKEWEKKIAEKKK